MGIFSSFAVAQAKGELDVVSTDLEALLGRKPLSVKDFLSGLYARFIIFVSKIMAADAKAIGKITGNNCRAKAIDYLSFAKWL